MKALKHFLFIHLLFLCFLVEAQVKTNFNNETIVSNKGQFVKDYKTKVDFEIPAKNIVELLEKEKREITNYNEIKPFKLAVPVSVNLDIANLINWAFDKGYAYGKFTVKLNGALSSSINFDQFYLPEGTEMYVYNENGNMITGAITENENNINKNWGSWVYKGEFLTIEIKTPLASKEQLLLHSNNIAYGYKEVYTTKVGGFGQSGACNINVLCPLGNGWEPERNSVALGISGDGAYTFSGSMIMNTCGINRPFFLTANHVYTDVTPVQNVTNWRFTFQAWSATCTPSQNSDGVTYNGSTLRANWANSDFCLVELNNIPPANSGINYAGWTRSATPAQNAAGIHHPSGDVMKISSAANPIAISSLAGFPANHHWQTTWTQGVTEGGSSGSPLFDQNHRIVGQLTGGPSICGGSALRDYYGRFDLSWTGGGSNTTRLSNWLDPNNSGATTINTTNISALSLPVTEAFITGSDNFCTGTSQYTLNTLPPGTTISWTSSNTNVATITPTGTTATLTMVNEGTVTITATITQCGTTVVRTKTVTMGFPYFYNPVNGADTAAPYGHYTFSQPLPWSYPTASYYWEVPSGWSILFGQGTSSIYVQAGGMGEGGAVEVDVTACGLTRLNHKYVEIGYSNCNGCIPDRPAPGGGKSDYTVKVSPNPARSTVVVILVPVSEKLKNSSYYIQQIRIADKMGSIKKQLSFNNRQLTQTININGLLPDIYVVSVYDGHFWQNVKLIVQ